MKNLMEFIFESIKRRKQEEKEELFRRILNNLEREGKITKIEKIIAKIFLKKNIEEFHPADLIKELFELGDVTLTEKESNLYFEKIQKDGKFYLKLKEDFIEKIKNLFQKALLKEDQKEERVWVGTRFIHVPSRFEYEIVYLGKVTKEFMDNWSLKQRKTTSYFYVLNPDDPIPQILVSEDYLGKRGNVEIRLQDFSEEEFESIMDFERWTLLLKRAYKGIFTKNEIRNELLSYPNGKIRIYKVFKAKDRFLRELTLEELKFIKDKSISGFEERWGKIILGFAIRPPKEEWLLSFSGTHGLVIDRTNLGKTLAGRLIGESRDRVTIANLIGFGTAEESHESILHNRNDPLFIDELEEEKRELGSYLLNLLKFGRINVSVGRAQKLETKFWGSLVFCANALGKTRKKWLRS